MACRPSQFNRDASRINPIKSYTQTVANVVRKRQIAVTIKSPSHVPRRRKKLNSRAQHRHRNKIFYEKMFFSSEFSFSFNFRNAKHKITTARATQEEESKNSSTIWCERRASTLNSKNLVSKLENSSNESSDNLCFQEINFLNEKSPKLPCHTIRFPLAPTPVNFPRKNTAGLFQLKAVSNSEISRRLPSEENNWARQLRIFSSSLRQFVESERVIISFLTKMADDVYTDTHALRSIWRDLCIHFENPTRVY